MSNNEQAQQTVSSELSVGQLLKQERERRQLTLEQAAQQLNLKAHVLQSIEADEPDKAILPTFMRGYLRAYARFLKIPEQPLLTRFEQAHQVKSAPVKMMKTFSNRQAKLQTETRFMWLTYVIAALLLASLAAWLWQGARDFNALNEPTAPITGLTLAEERAESIPVSTAVADLTVVPTTAPSLTVPTQVAPTLDNTVTAEATPQVAEALPSSAAQSVLASEPITVAALQETSSETVTANPVGEIATGIPAESFGDSSDSGLDRLKMTFSDNCWIDVLDSNGERIAYGTKQPGYVMELNAKGPFTITLGNPGVVTIEINQTPFDLSGFPGGRVAKFTLAGQNE